MLTGDFLARNVAPFTHLTPTSTHTHTRLDGSDSKGHRKGLTLCCPLQRLTQAKARSYPESEPLRNNLCALCQRRATVSGTDTSTQPQPATGTIPAVV